MSGFGSSGMANRASGAQMHTRTVYTSRVAVTDCNAGCRLQGMRTCFAAWTKDAVWCGAMQCGVVWTTERRGVVWSAHVRLLVPAC